MVVSVRNGPSGGLKGKVGEREEHQSTSHKWLERTRD